jgi:hypothetical protein
MRFEVHRSEQPIQEAAPFEVAADANRVEIVAQLNEKRQR